MATGELMKRRNTEPQEAHEPIDAIAKLPNHLAVLRMENDNMMALAAAHQRDPEAMKDELEQQLAAFPKHAAKMIYCKPVGKEEGSNQQKYARGLSVRAAEMLAEAYGYNRIRTAVEDIDADKVRVEATFVDFQKGRSRTDESVVSKFYTTRDKKKIRHTDDRFYNVVVRAEASKRVREVVTRCVSAGLKAWLYERCEELIDETLDDATMQKIIGNFANKRIAVEQLEKVVGKTVSAGWTKEDRKTLVGIWTAIESGEATVEEVFEHDPDQPKQDRKSPHATATENALTNPRVAAEPQRTEAAKPASKKDLAAAQAAAKAASEARPETANAVAMSLQRNIAKCSTMDQVDYIERELHGALERGDIDTDTHQRLLKQCSERSIQIERGE